MAFTTNKSLEQPINGSYVDTWNVPVNADMGIIDAALGNVTNLNATAGSANLANTSYQNMAFNVTGAMTANVTYTIPSGVGGQWIVRNATTDSVGGPWTVTIASAGGGSNVSVIRGKNTAVWSDGTNIRDVNENVESIGTVTSVAVSGGTTGLTANGSPITTNGTITLGGVLNVASGGTNVTSFGTGVDGALQSNVTGSGGMVLESNATLITANIGTPSAGNLVNTTGLPIANTTGTLAVNRGGTGATTLTANNILVGNGTSAVSFIAPGTSGNIVVSDGTNWTSAAPTVASTSGRLVRAPQVLTANGTYTTPATATTIYVEAVGAGGGGGGADVSNSTTQSSAAGGGGSGAYAAKYFSVAPNTTYTYAIGLSGTAGTSSGGDGGNGGNTTFTVNAVTVTAGGGIGGYGVASTQAGSLNPGGLGGTASSGDINISGNPGGFGFSTANESNLLAGLGGASFFGGAGRGTSTIGNNASGTSVTGSVGTTGSGGGGAATNSSTGAAGYAGGNGIIRIWEFT
jgi:hypothetical protein